MDDHSMFLFARPSIAEGIGRILDFGNTLKEYNSALTPEQADSLALDSDWRQVGADFTTATGQYRELLKHQECR